MSKNNKFSHVICIGNPFTIKEIQPEEVLEKYLKKKLFLL